MFVTRSAAPSSSQGNHSSIFSYPFTSSLQILCLRCTLAAGIYLAAAVYVDFRWIRYDISWPGKGPSIILGMTLFHLLSSAFSPQTVPLLNGVDMLLVVAEVSFNIWMLSREHEGVTLPTFQWSYLHPLGVVVSSRMFTALIIALLCVKILHLVDARGRTLLQRVDMLGSSVKGSSPGCPEGGRAVAWWKHPAQILFGRKIWRTMIPGESWWIISLRGVLTTVAASSLVAVAVIRIILEPMDEMDMIPTREFRISSLHPSDMRSSEPLTRIVIVVWSKDPLSDYSELSESISLESFPSSTPCRIVSITMDDIPIDLIIGSNEFLVFSCPEPFAGGVFLDQLYEASWELGDLRLTVNFTDLMSKRMQRPHRMTMNSLKVYLCLTRDIKSALMFTLPTLLPSGLHLVGEAHLAVRQHFRAPTLSTFGFIDLYDTIPIAQMPFVYPDPLVNDPDFRDGYNTGPNISTLRITHADLPPELAIIQEYRSKSVISGFAQVGGLGSVLSIAFVILFGNTLLGIMYRSKPLTPFGLVHNLQSSKARLSVSTAEKYHNLHSDLQSLKDNPGLLKFVLDTLVDLEVLSEEYRGPDARSQSPSEPKDIEENLRRASGNEAECADRNNQRRPPNDPRTSRGEGNLEDSPSTSRSRRA